MNGTNNKLFLIVALHVLFLIPLISQGVRVGGTGESEEEIRCGRYLSSYREFFRLELYKEAYGPWLNAFNECPSSSERMYLDGVTMYRSFIEATPDGPAKEDKIDTLMLIYDRRMENFGDEGNVLGRKGRDLLTYRSSDINEVQRAYEMFQRSIEIEGEKTQDAVFLMFISTSTGLHKAGQLDANQVISDYFTVIGIMDQMEGSNSRRERTRSTIDEIMLKENVLTCEALNGYYEPMIEQNNQDKKFLTKMVAQYAAAKCERSDLYATASESLYNIDPGPESAHNLAMLFIARNELNKAEGYLKEAVLGAGIEDETRAEWFYELAVISSANKEYCDAINYAREAISNKSDYGKAYILLGDCFIASRDNLGDDFQQRAAFWAAADKYQKAISVDPSVSEEGSKRLKDYAGQYPDHEDVFFLDMKDGDSYQVGGCINESTTIRSRK